MDPLVKNCENCNKQYQIIKQELDFLKKQGLPIPNDCPSCRQQRRLELRGSRQLYKTKCHKCGKEIVVAYDPTKVTNPVYCQEDYEKYFSETELIISDPLPEI